MQNLGKDVKINRKQVLQQIFRRLANEKTRYVISNLKAQEGNQMITGPNFEEAQTDRRDRTEKMRVDSRLEDLPVEIVLEIFQNLEPGASICLALSSPHLYSIHKTARLEMPSLWTDMATTPEEAHPIPDKHPKAKLPLGSLLEAWMGADYRSLAAHNSRGEEPRYLFNIPNPPYFVRKSVYRHPHDDFIMLERYRTYNNAKRNGKHVLPHPWNGGAEWVEEAQKIMVADLVNFPSFHAWTDFWDGSTFFYRSNSSFSTPWDEGRKLWFSTKSGKA